MATIGRGEQCTVAIPNSAVVSRVHCKLMRGANGGVVLVDCSSNGTWVDRRLVGKGRKAKLREGSEIMVQKPSVRAKVPRIAFRFHDAAHLGVHGTFSGGTLLAADGVDSDGEGAGDAAGRPTKRRSPSGGSSAGRGRVKRQRSSGAGEASS